MSCSAPGDLREQAILLLVGFRKMLGGDGVRSTHGPRVGSAAPLLLAIGVTAANGALGLHLLGATPSFASWKSVSSAAADSSSSPAVGLSTVSHATVSHATVEPRIEQPGEPSAPDEPVVCAEPAKRSAEATVCELDKTQVDENSQTSEPVAADEEICEVDGLEPSINPLRWGAYVVQKTKSAKGMALEDTALQDAAPVIESATRRAGSAPDSVFSTAVRMPTAVLPVSARCACRDTTSGVRSSAEQIG